jgi:mannose-6-phosphate isomerase-like protein (cupin superfamily)
MMAFSSSEQQIDGKAARPSKPVNLTAAAEPMSWEQACKVIGVTGPSERIALDVHGVSHAENGRLNDGSRETVYVVISGFGVLRCDDMDTQCTAGDVLFVPQGCPHRFERLDGDIRIWSISPVTP